MTQRLCAFWKLKRTALHSQHLILIAIFTATVGKGYLAVAQQIELINDFLGRYLFTFADFQRTGEDLRGNFPFISRERMLNLGVKVEGIRPKHNQTNKSDSPKQFEKPRALGRAFAIA